jgi:hypothetical protein
MTSISFTNTDDNYYELGQEFEKLASLIPTIPKDQCLSELELIEFVIAYIRQLQQLLTHDQWNECFHKLAVSMKNSFLSPSSSSTTSSSPQASDLINQFLLGSSRTSTHECSPTGTHRTPLATIHLDNTRLSWTVSNVYACVHVYVCVCVCVCDYLSVHRSIFLFISTYSSIERHTTKFH